MNGTKARTDGDGTAKPLTRIVGHARRGEVAGPGVTKADAYEAADGTRTPLRDEIGPNTPLLVLVAQLRRIADTDSPDGQWIGNVRSDAVAELARVGLVWQDGEYLRLTDRGDDLLRLVK